MNKIILIFFFISFNLLANFKFTYSVPDIVCHTCESAIDKYLKSIRSVVSTSYNQKLKTVEITLKKNRPLSFKERKDLDLKVGYRILEIKQIKP